ncbi:MAG: 50S ribosomal protein L32 [Gemmataceae bacterium]|nr:50S ribosomal protein L32 [Gemmataceae bacterium]
MAVPKRRVSPARQGMRRSHHAVKPKQIAYCSHCEQPVITHRICSNCGYYGGKEVIKAKEGE